MKEKYKLTKKELIPFANYWTYSSRQKPVKEREDWEELEIVERKIAITFYNIGIVLGIGNNIYLNLEKILK